MANAATKSFTIEIPLSSDAFGRWLEENNTRVDNISCQFGKYRVCLTRHRLVKNRERGDVSVTHTSDISVEVYDENLERALKRAVMLCQEEVF